MHAMITQAMEVAIVEITASAMQHIAMQMEHTVQDAVGYATASPAATESEFLRMGGFPGGYAAGGAASAGGYFNGMHGHTHGREGHSHAGGVWAGWSHSSNGNGGLSRSVSETSGVSMSSTSSTSQSSSHTEAQSKANGYIATATRNATQAVASIVGGK